MAIWKADLTMPARAVHIPHQVAVLDDRQGDAGDVSLLKGVAADLGRGHLPRQGDHRNRIHVGVGDAGHQVRGAGAGRGNADPRLAGGPGVAVGSVGSALFVAHQDMLDG